jgi:hypothetical protein
LFGVMRGVNTEGFRLATWATFIPSYPSGALSHMPFFLIECQKLYCTQLKEETHIMVKGKRREGREVVTLTLLMEDF